MLSRPYFKHSTFIPFFGLFFKCQNVQFLMFILFSVCYIQAKGESILQCQSALDSFCSLCRRGEDYQCHDDLLPTQVSSIRNLWKNMKNHCIIQQYILCTLYTCVYVLDIHTHCIYSFNVPCFVMRVRKGSWRLLCCKASTPWIFMGLCLIIK